MKTNKRVIIMALLLLLILGACRAADPGQEPTALPTLVVPTSVAEVTPVETVSPSPTAPTPATPTAIPTATATATTAPPATATSVPVDDTPAIVRIQFPAGATSETVAGTLSTGQHQQYLFRAQAGQTAKVALSSAGDAASFFVRGTEDGLFHKTPNDPSRQWQAILPRTQDYLLEVSAFQKTDYNFKLTIDPLPAPQVSAIGGVVYADANGNNAFDTGEAIVPDVQVYLRPHSCEASGLLANVVSGANGRYGFANLQPGSYCVSTVGGNGYVDNRLVTLTAGHPQEAIHLRAPQDEPAPIRIQFPAGDTGVSIQGQLASQVQAVYLFRASAGQTATLALTSAENSILFHLEGESDGVVYKHLLDGNSSWEGELGQTQDYRLTLDNTGPAATYTLELSIVD